MEHSASVVRWFCLNVDLPRETGSETSQSKINLKQWVPKLGAQLNYLFTWLPKLIAKAKAKKLIAKALIIFLVLQEQQLPNFDKAHPLKGNPPRDHSSVDEATSQLRSHVTLLIKCTSFSEGTVTEGTVTKFGQHIHLLVESLSAIFHKCLWHNIEMIMWFYWSVIFLLAEEPHLPNLDSRYTFWRGIDGYLFTGTGDVTIPNISKDVIL